MVLDGTNKRPRYFDGQFLQDTDFSDEQRYHRDRQHRHSRLLQVAGIAEGLAWKSPKIRPSETDAKGLTVTVSAGTAVDAQGRQIVLLSDRTNIPLSPTAEGVQVLYIQYAEQDSQSDQQDGTATRTEEVPELGFVSLGALNLAEQIAIAALTITDGKITQLNLDIRKYSGLRLPSSNNDEAPILRAASRNNSPTLATLTGDLSISGKVGIGTDSPQATLDVKGAIYAGNSDIYFTEKQHRHSAIGNEPGFAAIENSSDHDALMILGRAGTGKGRQVKLWDYLQVNGSLEVTGNVGIGIANPTSQLEVNGDIKTNVALISDNPHGANYAAFSHKDQGVAGGYALLQHSNGTTYLNAPTNQNLHFRINNDDKMIVHNSGNVGIGTVTPNQTLTVVGNFNSGKHSSNKMSNGGSLAIVSDAPQIDFVDTNNNNWAIHVNSNKMFFIRQPWNYQDLVLDGAGSVGIGTESPSAKLDVNGDIRASGAIHAGSSDIYFTHTQHNHTSFGNTTGYAAIENASNYDALMILGRAGTSHGRAVKLWDYLEVNGNLKVTGTIYVNNLPYRDRHNMQYDTANKEFCYDNSSAKSKTNIEPLVDDFTKILRISPKTYTRPGDSEHWEIGCIAEEFDQLGLNNLVYYDEDGSPGAINYRKISLYLVEVVKTIQSKIEAYERRIELLESSAT